MKINFHDLHAQYIDYKNEINLAIQEVLDSSQFIMGQAVFDFENALANYLECQHVMTCASGTDALLLALLAIDIKPGDEVITSPFSFIAAAEVVSLLHAKPVFADIQADTYHLDPKKIIEKMTPKTRAIIPVSLYGQPADMDEINAIAEVYGQQYGNKIYVIEDAAQSVGAAYRGKKSANLSDIGCISFFPTKPLGCYGDGGAITAKDQQLAEKIKYLRSHGQTKRYSHTYIGFNCRLDTLQAAILTVKLKHFESELKKRIEIASYYHQLLAKYPIILPSVKADRTSVYAQYSIRVKKRAHWVEHFKNKQIPLIIHYPKPLHLQDCFNYLGYQRGDFPIAETVTNEIISLPMSAFLTRQQQDYIHDAIEEMIEETIYEY